MGKPFALESAMSPANKRTPSANGGDRGSPAAGGDHGADPGGVILSLAASPRWRRGSGSIRFISSTPCAVPAAVFIVLIGVSFLSPRQIRRAALIVFAISIILIVATLLFGPKKGSHAGSRCSSQHPASESAKPRLRDPRAWCSRNRRGGRKMPATSMRCAADDAGVLLGWSRISPDMLILMVWGALFLSQACDCLGVGLRARGGGLFSAYLLCRTSPPHQAFMDRLGIPFSRYRDEPAMRLVRPAGEGIASAACPTVTRLRVRVGAEEFGIILCLALLRCSPSS